MKVTPIYTVLLSQLKALGYPVFPRPYSESMELDSTLGVTLHLYLEDIDTEMEGEHPKQRQESPAFKCDVQSTDIDNDLTTVLGIVDIVADIFFNVKSGNATIETYKVSRGETTEKILYTIDVTYTYWNQYE